MAYTPQTWIDQTMPYALSADRMNHIEAGIAAAGSGSSSANVLDWVNVRLPPYNARGDNAADDTAAIQQAITDAQARTVSGVSARPTVFIPSGVYACHEVIGTPNVRLMGNGAGLSQLRYNGSGGANSYTLSVPATAAFGDGGISHLGIRGHSLRLSTDAVAQNCLLITPSAEGQDFGFEASYIQVGQCFADGILYGTNSVASLQFHVDHLRVDGVGNWGINVQSTTSQSAPFVINNFSYDSTLYDPSWLTTYGVAMTNGGYWDGTRLGYGFMYVAAGSDIHFNLRDARILTGKTKTFDNRRQTFYVTGGTSKWIFENIVGVSVFQDYPGIFFRDKGGQADAVFQGQNRILFSKLLETVRGTVPEWDIGGWRNDRTALVTYWGGAGQSQGLVINGTQLEFRNSAPTGLDRDYKLGDRIFMRSVAVGQPQGWVVSAPATGWGNDSRPNLTTAGVVVSGNQTITIPALDLYRHPVGAAVTLVGAGPAAADLNTVIDNIDYDAYTIHVTNSPSTSVNPATIKMQGCTFTPMANL